MGWNVSHGTNAHCEVRRSYTTTSNLGRQLAHVLPGSDWKILRPLFNRPTGDPFSVPPNEAGRMAVALRKAASHRLMPADWAQDAREFADAADRAARFCQPWEWR